MLATTIHKSNTTPHHQKRSDNHDPQPRSPTLQNTEKAGLLPQSPIVCLAIQNRKPVTAQRLSRTQPAPTTGAGANIPTTLIPHMRGRGKTEKVLLRKEVIQPHLPVRLPCYDFVPIADPTFDGSLHKG